MKFYVYTHRWVKIDPMQAFHARKTTWSTITLCPHEHLDPMKLSRQAINAMFRYLVATDWSSAGSVERKMEARQNTPGWRDVWREMLWMGKGMVVSTDLINQIDLNKEPPQKCGIHEKSRKSNKIGKTFFSYEFLLVRALTDCLQI